MWRGCISGISTLIKRNGNRRKGMDQLPGVQPVSRWETKVGKFGPQDDFDQNRYANNNRTQFLNYDFLYNPVWDNMSDTRGYSYGFATALVQKNWRLAFGIFMAPNTANGSEFDFVDLRELGYNLELTVKPNDTGTVIRLLSYFNEVWMGDYNAALDLAPIPARCRPSLSRVRAGQSSVLG